MTAFPIELLAEVCKPSKIHPSGIVLLENDHGITMEPGSTCWFIRRGKHRLTNDVVLARLESHQQTERSKNEH